MSYIYAITVLIFITLLIVPALNNELLWIPLDLLLMIKNTTSELRIPTFNHNARVQRSNKRDYGLASRTIEAPMLCRCFLMILDAVSFQKTHVLDYQQFLVVAYCFSLTHFIFVC